MHLSPVVCRFVPKAEILSPALNLIPVLSPGKVEPLGRSSSPTATSTPSSSGMVRTLPFSVSFVGWSVETEVVNSLEKISLSVHIHISTEPGSRGFA